MAAATVRREDQVPAGGVWHGVVGPGERLRIVDIEGHQGVDFLCFNASDPQERYHAPNTLKATGRLTLEKGTVLYSDRARPLMTMVEDSCGGHDTIGGCCSAVSNEMLYGVKNVPGCRENFLSGLRAYGLGWREVVPNINFFCSVPVLADGSFADGVFVEGHSKAGDSVELQAEMEVLAVISNCPQVNNPCNSGAPSPILVSILSRHDETG